MVPPCRLGRSIRVIFKRDGKFFKKLDLLEWFKPISCGVFLFYNPRKQKAVPVLGSGEWIMMEFLLVCKFSDSRNNCVLCGVKERVYKKSPSISDMFLRLKFLSIYSFFRD